MKVQDSNYILDFLESKCPDKAPLSRLDDYELGILIGQRQLIEALKIRLKVEDEKEQEIR